MGNWELVYSNPFVSYGSGTRSQSKLQVPEPQLLQGLL